MISSSVGAQSEWEGYAHLPPIRPAVSPSVYPNAIIPTAYRLPCTHTLLHFYWNALIWLAAGWRAGRK